MLKKKKRKKIKKRYGDFFLPKLPNDQSKIEFLSSLRKIFPGIFHENGPYLVDPLKIIEQNQLLLKKLKKISNYNQLMKDKEKLNLLSLNIKQKNKELIYSLQLSPMALKKFRENLKRQIDSLEKGPRSYDRCPLLEKILSLAEVFTGKKKRPSTKSKNAQLQLKDLSDFIQIFIFAQTADGRIPDDPKELKDAINHIKEEQLDFLTDQVTFERKMRPLEEILGRELKAMMKKMIRKKMDQLLDQTVRTKRLARLKITLEECPPMMALFRGLLGHDCSTQYSSGYALGPYERTFCIMGTKGCKGYVAGTIVRVQGFKTLYLHTIAGPRVSGAEAKLILQGLYLRRKVLGVNAIVLPSLAQLENLVNYLDIKNTFQKIIELGQPKRIQYLDSLYRKAIGKFVPPHITYDCPEFNRTGYLYSPSSHNEKEFQNVVSVSTYHEDYHWEYHSSPTEEGILLALDFLSMGHHDQAERVAAIFGLGLDSLLKYKLKFFSGKNSK